MALHNIPDADFFMNMAEGTNSQYTVIHKSGKYGSATTTYTPICPGGFYRTPQVGGQTTLRVKSGGSANDSAAGTGARSIYLEGLDSAGNVITEVIATNGASAGPSSVQSFLRLTGIRVATSGTYATQTTGSHGLTIFIENTAGTETWGGISSLDRPKSEAEIGMYTVPNGKVAYIRNISIYVEYAKPATVCLFQRQNILETIAPYTPDRIVFSTTNISDGIYTSDCVYGPFPALTDVGFGVKAVSTSIVSVSFDLILKDV